jgi:hypothetical protein
VRHPLHSICPYFAMFPEEFVARQVDAYSSPGDCVFDPFCGRGTTVFESLLHGRNAAGIDINPVAACISGAKADSPSLQSIQERLEQLRDKLEHEDRAWNPPSEFFRFCFHPMTLKQLLFLRRELRWRDCKVDRFVAALILGVLHGESHKTPNCLSNRMPRTISTKPDYSVRWWTQKDLSPPKRDTFDILERAVRYRLSQPPPFLRGTVRLEDARRASNAFPELLDMVRLVVTSPPYLDTTNFSEDQWLRQWFLGGPNRPNSARSKSDDRYRSLPPYWQFLAESWQGCSALLQREAVIVVRLGGKGVTQQVLFSGLFNSLVVGLPSFTVTPVHSGIPTEIKNRQTNVFRPGTSSPRFEYDFAFAITTDEKAPASSVL